MVKERTERQAAVAKEETRVARLKAETTEAEARVERDKEKLERVNQEIAAQRKQFLDAIELSGDVEAEKTGLKRSQSPSPGLALRSKRRRDPEEN